MNRTAAPGKRYPLGRLGEGVSRPGRHRPWTYAAAGVDRSAIGEALRGLLAAVRYRPPPSSGRALAAPGHYAGLVRLGRETVAVTTDTVGTKVLLAEQLGAWEEVGEDLVAINVNDLASVGARPFGLVDTVSCARPEPTIFRAIGRGIDRGLRAGRVALLGGETAVVPEVVRGVDLGATALGFFPGQRHPILGGRLRPGDVLLGVPSSGAHANGFTLIRRLLSEASVDLRRPRPGGRGSVGRELIRATRGYVSVSEALADLEGTSALAHVSGGGVRNLLRLSRRVGFDLSDWPEPPGLFGWLKELGAVSDEEMFQTFNMGIGFIAAIRPRFADRALARLAQGGVRDARPIGLVSRTPGVRLPRWELRYTSYA